MKVHRAPTGLPARHAALAAFALTIPWALWAQADPDGGSFTAQPNSQNNVVIFTVTNNGGGPDRINFTCTPSGSVTWCSAPTGQDFAAWQSVDVEVLFNVGASGTGTVHFEATGMEFFTWDDAWYNITVAGPSYSVAVTPDGGSQSAPGGSMGKVATFTVTNQGNQGSLTYALSIVGCTAPLVNCTSDAGSVPVGQGLSQDVTAHFDAQNTTGTGTITLRATHTGSGTSNDGWINVSVTAQTIFIYPDGSSLSKAENTPGYSESFGTSGLISGQSYFREILCTGQVLDCSSTVPDPFTAPMFSIPVNFGTSSVGTGKIRLKVYAPGGSPSDSGWYDVTVIETVAPTTSLMLPTGEVSVEFPTIKIGWCDNNALNAASRWIKVNGTDRTSSFDYNTADGPACTAKAASTTSSVSLTLGTNSVEAHICDNSGNCDTDTYWITRRDATAPTANLLSATTVSTEFPTIQLEWCDNESLNAASRWIKVNGVDRTSSFDYVTTGGTSCGAIRATSTTNSVSLAGGSNTVEASICDNWSNCITPPRSFTITRATNAPIVTLVNHNRDNQDRALCLTLAAGDGTAVQCGDLLAFHAMPAFRSMGRDRSLTLVYNSATAEPRPRVAANLTLPSGEQPLSVDAELTVDSVLRARGTYSSWTPDSTRQVVLAFDADTIDFATGLYPFTFLARSNFPNAVQDFTVTDTLIIVNRSSSEFGAGWYLAGVERLFLSQPGGSILWVGGDGSAKVYRDIGGGQWQAPAGAFRDLIVRVGTSSYERRLKHGVTVTFDAVGRHICTKNRLGHVTTFTWDPTTGKLIQIRVPGTAGGTCP